jgi:hypothetical protein
MITNDLRLIINNNYSIHKAYESQNIFNLIITIQCMEIDSANI